ncbi:sensor histidine kinase [Paenibacillus sp. LPE1-1-1.1]|uniref:sensor histidine kinase n=1 Tax=Paenibacillus sp. LPE1-1-1.1 TaxID=3135230 RepID=UPI003431AAB9
MTRFSAMARVLSHLGDQLISSSTVAILELIKNAFDAGSPSVKVIINQANRTMVIEDQGSGMSREDILNKYLVIGTTDRLEKKERIKKRMTEHLSEEDAKKEDNQVPLGEKGLGRFATMKLAEKLVLFTKSKTKNDGSLLMIDWNKFNYSSKVKLEDIKVHLLNVNSKNIPKNYGESFVKIKLYDIKDFYDSEEWNKKRFENFYKKNFMKYINPFQPSKGFQITLEIYTVDNDFYRYTPEIIDRKFLDQAPYKIIGHIEGSEVTAHYYIKGEDEQEFVGKMPKVIQELEGRLEYPEDKIGPFSFEFYFFNRNRARLDKIKGYEDYAEKKRILDQYNGGIMIYRDNFRVLPYAEPGNDWLELDSNGFRASGIRFNTLQTVGTIHISSLDNGNLKDQTNREGLVHNKAYENLKIALLSILKTYKNKIEDYYPKKIVKKGPVETEDIHEAIKPLPSRIEHMKNELRLLNDLLKGSKASIFQSVNALSENITVIEREYLELKNSVNELDDKIKDVEVQQRRIFDLAGIGMTAETAAHEMRSYLGRINSYLIDLRRRTPSEKEFLTNLLHNTRALDLVVSRLDLQSIAKRRTRSKVNLVSIISDICESKSLSWELEKQDSIKINVTSEGECFLKANQGMLIQVFDNLLSNSYYWLQKHKKRHPEKQLNVHVHIKDNGIVEFSDNGMGITHGDARYIFEPFFTRKLDGEGRGLGLYIVSEILNFHHSEIILSEDQNEFGNYYRFIIDFSGIQA